MIFLYMDYISAKKLRATKVVQHVDQTPLMVIQKDLGIIILKTL